MAAPAPSGERLYGLCLPRWIALDTAGRRQCRDARPALAGVVAGGTQRGRHRRREVCRPWPGARPDDGTLRAHARGAGRFQPEDAGRPQRNPLQPGRVRPGVRPRVRRAVQRVGHRRGPLGLVVARRHFLHLPAGDTPCRRAVSGGLGRPGRDEDPRGPGARARPVHGLAEQRRRRHRAARRAGRAEAVSRVRQPRPVARRGRWLRPFAGAGEPELRRGRPASLCRQCRPWGQPRRAGSHRRGPVGCRRPERVARAHGPSVGGLRGAVQPGTQPRRARRVGADRRRPHQPVSVPGGHDTGSARVPRLGRVSARLPTERGRRDGLPGQLQWPARR